MLLGNRRVVLLSTLPPGLRIILKPPFVATISAPITAFGDSSVADLGGEAQQPWPAQLRSYVHGNVVDNEGIPGQTMGQVVSRMINGYCIRTSSSISGAGNVTLDGYLTSGGIVSLMPGRNATPLQVVFTFAADETGKSFTVSGTGGSLVATVTATSWSAGVATATTNVAHGITVGQTFSIFGIVTANLDPGNNGTFTALAGTTGTTLKYSVAVNPSSLTRSGQLYGPQSEVVAGTAAGTASTTKSYLGVATISASGASAGAVSIGIPLVIAQPQWGLTRAQQLAAGTVFFEEDKNTFNNFSYRVYAEMVAGYAAAAAAAPNLMIIPVRTGPIPADGLAIVAPGGPVWIAAFASARWLLENYPDNSVETMRALESGALPYYPIDGISASFGGVPWSETYFTTGQSGGTHLGPYGNSVLNVYEAWPVIAAVNNQLSWVRPREEKLVNGAAATTARGSGGLIASIKIWGLMPDSVSISSADGFTASVSGSTIQIKNVVGSPSPLDAGHYDCTVTVNRSGQPSYSCQTRLMVGAADTTPSDVTLWSTVTGFNIASGSQPTLDSTRKLSIAFRATADALMTGVQGYLFSSHGLNLAIQHSSTNTYSIVARDFSGAAIINQRTVNGTIVAGVPNWCMLSVDLTGGSPVSQLFLNDASSNVSTTILGDITLNNNWFVGSFTGKGDRPFIGNVMELWIAADFVDWSNSTNRRALFNVDKTPVALPSDGAIAGVQPYIWLRGNNADWWYGKNYAPIDGGYLNYGYVYPTDNSGIP